MPSSPIMPLLATAQRVTRPEAKRHFDDGGSVLVSEYGDERTCRVHVGTTVHSNQTTTWADLVEQVDMWRNRYPNQRFYVIPGT